MRLLFGVLLLVPALSWAQGEPGLRDLFNARMVAMGTAGSALGLGPESVTENPATMSAYKRYQLALTGDWDWVNKFAFGSASIVDSQTSAVAAGVAYQLVSFGRGADRKTANIQTVASSISIGDVLFLGVSGKNLILSGAETGNAITMDAGLLLKFGPVQLGGVAHNIIDINHPEMSRYYTFGAAFAGGSFNAAFDLRADFENLGRTVLGYNGGIEWIIGNAVPLRGGYSFDGLDGTHYLSGGIGFTSEGTGVDLAYRQALNGPAKQVVLTLQMQIPGS